MGLMPQPFVSVNLIRELRLRNWARKHYVGPAARGRHWHPIVLEEMSFRDAELAETALPVDDCCSPFVPLEPTEQYHLDEPHDAVPTPKIMEAGERCGTSKAASLKAES
jgi:hypothetical protein